MFAGTTGPQSKESSNRFVSTLPLLLGVVIKVERLPFVPTVLVELLLPECRSSVPFLGRLLPRSGSFPLSSVGLSGDGKWRHVEFILQVQLVAEDVTDGGSDVVFVLSSALRASVSMDVCEYRKQIISP
jgi:hypothetical protein